MGTEKQTDKNRIGGGKPGPGRKKGVPNKNSAALRDMILGALHEQEGGGVEYLKRQAQENPGPFMTLLGKVLPTTLAGDAENPVSLVAKIERVIIG